jgi:hypothetical protein
MSAKRLACGIFCIFLSFSLSGCRPGQLLEPTITPSPTIIPTSTVTATLAPTYTPIPIATNTPVLYQITFYAFHDYNGNGKQDDGEPSLEGIINRISIGECTTTANGKCEINGITEGLYSVTIIDNRNVPPWEKMRFLMPSISEVRTISQGLEITVDANIEINIPLGQGFIVLPLSICIERANHWAFWKAVGKSV